MRRTGAFVAWDVFLCHASADKEAVRALAAALEGAGKRVWLDEKEIGPGASIPDKVNEGLARSRWLVACLSDRQLASGWAQGEVDAVLHAELSDGATRVVPVIVGELDEAHLPPLLRAKRRVDWRSTAGQGELLAWVSGAPRAPRGKTTERRLRLRAEGDQLEARWVGGEEDQHRFDLPMVKGDDDDHRWYLEQYLRLPGPGDHARARRFEERLQQWGERLHADLWTHGGTHPLDALAGTAGPKVLTLVSDDPGVLSLPWELLRTPAGSLVFRDVSIRRQFPGTPATSAPVVAVPLRVLLVIARPTDTGFIDPRTSAAPVLDALDRLGGNVHVDFCEPPTLPELDRRLTAARETGQPFHVVHFDGHGVYLRQSGVGALCFEQPDATKDLVEGRRLGELLAAMRVPLALLEACQTSDLDKEVFGSVAPALLQHGVGSVIAFSHSVTVTAARLLVQAFYEGLCDGASVGEALLRGRRALQADPRRDIGRRERIELHDWHIAQLYQVGEDPVMVPGGAPAKKGGKALRGRPPDKHFPPPPLYGFTGRAGDLLALRRALRKHPAVVVHGMGGMGKTSLTREAAHWWARTGERAGGACFTTFERRAGPMVACRELLAYVHGADAVPGSDEEAWVQAVALFREEPLLWIWDNFESTLPQYAADAYPEEDRRDLRRLVRELTDPAYRPQGWLVVTCRSAASGLPGIKALHLGGLGSGDALDLAELVLDRHDVPVGSAGFERSEIEELVRVLDGHPLSLELVLPHLDKLTPAAVRAEYRRLLDRFANPEAEEDRNKGLRASLEFSTSRLSEAARAVLPRLAWFEGGAFEVNIIDLVGLEPAAWEAVRAELEGVALVREEDAGVQIGGRPFLRFHPTLPLSASPELEAAERFVEIYRALAGGIDQALDGGSPAGGMACAAREEGNLRRAVRAAFDRGDGREAWFIANTVGSYLERAGRPKEQARWAAGVRQRLGALAPEGGAESDEGLAAERQHAWGLCLEGRAQDAVDLLQAQLLRLEGAAGREHQVAPCRFFLGRVLLHSGRPDLALGPLEAAAAGFAELGERANLSAALGDRANALHDLGLLDEALEVSERGLAINRELGRTQAVAAGLGQTAAILAAQQRHVEADRRYDEALQAARDVGDAGLEAATLQHQGLLARNTGDLDRAVALFHDALDRFGRAVDEGGEMQTSDLLGSAEQLRGHHDAARAWNARARELAIRLGDRRQLAATAHNLGILHQVMAEDPDLAAERPALLGQAVASVEEALAICRELNTEPDIAASLFQLGVLHRLLGDLDTAERHAREALAIRERLRSPDTVKDYANLEQIAQARGDAAAAARWAARKEEQLAELDRLARGPADNPTRVPSQLLDALRQLAAAAHHHRSTGTPPSAELAEVLAQLSQAPPPLPAVGAFLSGVAAGDPVPAVPGGLPEEIAGLLQALAKATAG